MLEFGLRLSLATVWVVLSKVNDCCFHNKAVFWPESTIPDGWSVGWSAGRWTEKLIIEPVQTSWSLEWG